MKPLPSAIGFPFSSLTTMSTTASTLDLTRSLKFGGVCWVLAGDAASVIRSARQKVAARIRFFKAPSSELDLASGAHLSEVDDKIHTPYTSAFQEDTQLSWSCTYVGGPERL